MAERNNHYEHRRVCRLYSKLNFNHAKNFSRRHRITVPTIPQGHEIFSLKNKYAEKNVFVEEKKNEGKKN